ncbi:MAG: UDP-N-acetylmuramoyl-tripeptide--D-alanyl-D-alanine ligase [Kordiimonas sp.]
MIDNFDQIILWLLIGLTALWFSFERGLSLMMFFQQEEYDDGRFLAWLKEKRGFDRATSFWLFGIGLAATLAHALLADSGLLSYLGGALFLLTFGAFIHGVRRSKSVRDNSKKPLVKTTRVKRIMAVFMALNLVIYIGISLISNLAPSGENYAIGITNNSDSWLDIISFNALTYNWPLVVQAFLLIGYCQLLPVTLVFANKLLEPMEERVKAGFRKDAIQKFHTLKPKVIAITGSFGKTSTKHILSHVLGAAAPSLATPGSVNTDMGITRVIREQLKPEHQYFVVEMGAYGPGSIARLCKLTPPDVGLITAVGAAHYERFKSLDTVAKAKFELAEATFAQNGNVVVNTDGIERGLLEDRLTNVPGNYLKVGEDGDVKLTKLEQTADGLSLTITDSGEEHLLKCPLFGRHQAGNILLAAACARAIGLPWSAIKGALASVPQIRHRLEVSKNAAGPTLVNDAYNSNPVGFASALESLDALVEEGGRRILVTPGMVELGEKHESEHERLGKLAAHHCDVVLVVTPERIPSFLTGLQSASDGQVTIMSFSTQEEAENWAKTNWQTNDVVLFENNLPDLYEATFKF